MNVPDIEQKIADEVAFQHAIQTQYEECKNNIQDNVEKLEGIREVFLHKID